MFTLAVNRNFVAQHFLIGGDWGKENDLHSHFYKVEIRLEGDRLDGHGYLADIVEIENILDALVEYFRDKTLNKLDEFSSLNPSIENFSRIFCQKFTQDFQASNIQRITTIIWENEIAWASYQQELHAN